MSRPLKIIYLTVSMPYGSAEEFLIAEAKEILSQMHEVLIVPRSVRHGLVNDDARELLSVSLPKPLLSFEILAAALCEAFRKPIQCLGIILGLLSGWNLGALPRNLAVLPKSLWLARIAAKVRAEHIHAQWSLTTATMAMTASGLTGIPWSFTAHRGDIAGNNLLETKMRNASFVRFVSLSGLDMARAICGSAFTGRSHVIHMGVQIPAPSVTSSPGTGMPVIFCPANLIPVKGHRYLLEAIAILRSRDVQCLLQMAGDGPLHKRLEQQVEALRLTQDAVFLGQIPHSELLDLYRKGSVNIVVLPSIAIGTNEHEGIPVSLMEAMSHGIPCVSTTTGGIPELLGNESGMLVPPRDARALADAIEKLLRDDLLRKRVATNGYKRIVAEFNIKNVVEELTSLIAATRPVVRGPITECVSGL